MADMFVTVRVDAANVGEMIEALATVDATIVNIGATGADADEREIDRKVRETNKRRMATERDDDTTATLRRTAKIVTGKRVAPVNATRGGRRVVYTPNVTAKQMASALDKLRKGSLSAFVLTTIAKRQTIGKRDLLARAEKAGFNPQSVDNVVWQFQKRGLVQSADAE